MGDALEIVDMLVDKLVDDGTVIGAMRAERDQLEDDIARLQKKVEHLEHMAAHSGNVSFFPAAKWCSLRKADYSMTQGPGHPLVVLWDGFGMFFAWQKRRGEWQHIAPDSLAKNHSESTEIFTWSRLIVGCTAVMYINPPEQQEMDAIRAIDDQHISN